MKLEILKGFYDKYNDTLYNPGELIDFKTDRAKELLENEMHLVRNADEDVVIPKKTKRRIKKDE